MTAAKSAVENVAPDFPAPDDIAKVRELHAQVNTLKDAVAAAERVLSLTIKTRDAIELSGEKPDDVIRIKQQALDLARRKFAQAKIDLVSALIEDARRYEQIRAEAWCRFYADVVQPNAEKIALARDLLERAADGIIAAVKPESETIRRLEALDAATNEWNDAVSALGGPGNAQLKVTPTTKSVFSSFRQVANFYGFETVIATLRSALDPPPAPEIKTEESIARERETAANAAFVQQQQAEILARRERKLIEKDEHERSR